ncbi:MAG: adenosylhomocysteinase, partial [Candidatus Aenigmarchaeota archaeon]|nr:adenosylhomocysteinase [Candidatus Aenigmarchaeota archaeon]
MEENYSIVDINLAQTGEKQITLAREQMVGLVELKKELAKKDIFKGVRIGMALHVTKETAVLVESLVELGAQIAITGCNPLSTQDDVAAALAKKGVRVYAKKGVSVEEYYGQLNKVLDF